MLSFILPELNGVLVEHMLLTVLLILTGGQVLSTSSVDVGALFDLKGENMTVEFQ